MFFFFQVIYSDEVNKRTPDYQKGKEFIVSMNNEYIQGRLRVNTSLSNNYVSSIGLY